MDGWMNFVLQGDIRLGVLTVSCIPNNPVSSVSPQKECCHVYSDFCCFYQLKHTDKVCINFEETEIV